MTKLGNYIVRHILGGGGGGGGGEGRIQIPKKNPETFLPSFEEVSTVFEEKQGNSVARDLPPTGSEGNTTIFVLCILDIDSHCPYLLSGETTFQLTSC